jgi:hypothetical protein
MAEPTRGVTLPTTVTEDGWEATSGSSQRPTEEEMRAALAGTGETEPKAPAETPPPTPPAETPSEPELDEPQPDEGDEEEKPPEKPSKKKQRLSDRAAKLKADVDRYTWQKNQAMREAEEWQRRVEALRREAEPPPQPKPAPEPVLEKKPTWKAFEDDGKDWDEYQAALDQWHEQQLVSLKADLTEKASAEARMLVERQERQRQHDLALERHYARINDARTKYPDYEEAAQSLADVPRTKYLDYLVLSKPYGQDLIYQLGKHPAEAQFLSGVRWEQRDHYLDPRPFTTALDEAKDPAQLLLYLAQHEDEFDRLARLSVERPDSAILALGSLSERLSGAHGSPGPANYSKAKPPIRPVGGLRGVSEPKDPDELEFGPEYVALQNKRDLKAGRSPF